MRVRAWYQAMTVWDWAKMTNLGSALILVVFLQACAARSVKCASALPEASPHLDPITHRYLACCFVTSSSYVYLSGCMPLARHTCWLVRMKSALLTYPLHSAGTSIATTIQLWARWSPIEQVPNLKQQDGYLCCSQASGWPG